MPATNKLAPHSPYPMRLLIVDQEPRVRTELARLCFGIADLRVVGEADSGGTAIDAAQSLSPDVMLIDVALPDMSGFDVLHGAGNSGSLGIMTSRRADFAERALAEGAVDYLIKPVDADRFERAIALVRQRHKLEVAAQAQLIRGIGESLVKRPKILVGERQHRLYPLDVEKIEYIEADGNYVTIRAANQEYISRDTIKRLSADLAAFGFVRIDRSILLNIRAVQFAEPVGHGTLAFTLASGTCLHSSKTYRDEIQSILPWHHCRAGARM
jgi:two-component system, LytTR family, response regulator